MKKFFVKDDDGNLISVDQIKKIYIKESNFSTGDYYCFKIVADQEYGISIGHRDLDHAREKMNAWLKRNENLIGIAE